MMIEMEMIEICVRAEQIGWEMIGIWVCSERVCWVNWCSDECDCIASTVLVGLNIFNIWILYLHGNWYIKCHWNIVTQDEGQTQDIWKKWPMIARVLIYVPRYLPMHVQSKSDCCPRGALKGTFRKTIVRFHLLRKARQNGWWTEWKNV